MKKNEKGITLWMLCILIVILIIALCWLFGNNSKNNSTTENNSSSKFTTFKESKSTYTAKSSKIDYKSLARNPNMYKGKDYTFTGEVIQVMEDKNNLLLRVNVTAKRYEYLNETYYEDTILVKYKYSSSSESRILEDDIITLYGKSMGTYTYESVLGSPITVPYIDAMYIDIKSK